MSIKKIFIVIGTRPDAIKSLVLYQKLKQKQDYQVFLCNTGQHTDMMDQVLEVFEVTPDINLKASEHNNGLDALSAFLIKSIGVEIEKFQPDLVIVQGDTISSFSGALAAYHHKIKIAHVEAGLRTYDKYAPFPEEMYRVMIDQMADYLFAPTFDSSRKLLEEGIIEEKIHIVGNTGIDALFAIRDKWNQNQLKLQDKKLIDRIDQVKKDSKLILLTLHRRELIDTSLDMICQRLLEVLKNNPKYFMIFPMHKNPVLRKTIHKHFDGIDNMILMDALPYGEFIYMMMRSDLILTDSGGIQEEGPSLGKRVVILRDTTEREEVLHHGTKLARLKEDNLEALINSAFVAEDLEPVTIYGNGDAVDKIIRVLDQESQIV